MATRIGSAVLGTASAMFSVWLCGSAWPIWSANSLLILSLSGSWSGLLAMVTVPPVSLTIRRLSLIVSSAPVKGEARDGDRVPVNELADAVSRALQPLQFADDVGVEVGEQ